MENFNTDITESLNVLNNGGIILYPTDTIWGIGCDATNAASVKKIYQLKKREEKKSICESGKKLWSFSSNAVARTTSPVNAVCITRNFCMSLQSYQLII